MKEIEKLEDKNVPLLAKAWIHNSEILGVTREGNLVVVAKIIGEQEDSIFNPIPEVRKRSQRKPKLNTNDTSEETKPE